MKDAGYKPPNWNGDWKKVSDFSVCYIDNDYIMDWGTTKFFDTDNKESLSRPGRKGPCFAHWGCGPK